MKPTRLMLAFAAFIQAGVAAAQAEVIFSADVKFEDSPIQTVSFPIRVGHLRTETLPFGNLRLDLAAREVRNASPQGHVRLLQLDIKTGEYKMLHEATISQPSGSSRQITYLICKDQVIFSSPSQTNSPRCNS